jgi:recombination protein RecA
MDNDKLKKLDAAISAINKDFGTNSVTSLSDNPQPIESISTGSFGLDLALGIGGLPCGRIVEIYGPQSSGKTTIALHVIAEAQKKGGVCVFIDAEHAFDPIYAESIGVDIEKLKFSQPDYGEQALEIADRLIESGSVSVLVIDSVAALIPKAELEGAMGESKMGKQAALMSQACRKMVASVAKTGTILIFINQMRQKFVMFGNPETTTGGDALKFYASVRLDVRTASFNKVDEEVVSNHTKVKVVKNKVASPFKIAEFDIVYGKGIDRVEELIKVGIDLDVIKKGGAWLTYKDTKVQGKDALKQLVTDNAQFDMDLFTDVKQAIQKCKTDYIK